jgi:parallel beta-helix repeat protein
MTIVRQRPALSFFIACLALDLCCLGHVQAADYYVDGAAGNDSHAGGQSSPFASIHRALHVSKPGDTIHVAPTATYTGPVWIATGGTAQAPITLEGEGTGVNLPKIVGSNSFGIQVAAGVSHVTIQGFDISAPGNWSGIYLSPGTTHIIINGNSVHDSGASGIGSVGSDYVTVSNNVVYNNAFVTTSSCGSGISLYQLRNSDISTTVKNYVVNNIAFQNTNTPGGSCNDSDGNGIIIDDSRNTQHNSPYGPYMATTLIANNVAYKNGRRGIHVYSSDNVVVSNNTLYENNQDPYAGYFEDGEITLLRAGGVLLYNNVVYSDGVVNSQHYHAGISIQQCEGAPIVLNDNLLYNPYNNSQYAIFINASSGWASTNTISVAPLGRGNKWGDPLFRSPTGAGVVADFRVRSASPALGIGNRRYAPTSDILGMPTPVRPTAGAYELPAN